MSEWINVEDRLPDEDSEVLCFCDSGDTKYIVLASHHNSFFSDFDGELLPATYWHPIPDPPNAPL